MIDINEILYEIWESDRAVEWQSWGGAYRGFYVWGGVCTWSDVSGEYDTEQWYSSVEDDTEWAVNK